MKCRKDACCWEEKQTTTLVGSVFVGRGVTKKTKLVVLKNPRIGKLGPNIFSVALFCLNFFLKSMLALMHETTSTKQHQHFGMVPLYKIEMSRLIENLRLLCEHMMVQITFLLLHIPGAKIGHARKGSIELGNWCTKYDAHKIVYSKALTWQHRYTLFLEQLLCKCNVIHNATVCFELANLNANHDIHGTFGLNDV